MTVDEFRNCIVTLSRITSKAPVHDADAFLGRFSRLWWDHQDLQEKYQHTLRDYEKLYNMHEKLKEKHHDDD